MATAVKAKTLDRKDLTGPALRTFFNIADAWRLSEAEQMAILGLDSRSTLQNWKRGEVAALSKDALERISYVMGIYKGLQILVPASADDWVRKPNKARSFSGRSALERMMSGNVSDLYVVRQYVDGQRGWYRLSMTIPVVATAWSPCYRIIPSRFPPIGLFEKVADPADLEAVFLIEAMTNDRLRDEVGELALVPPEDRVAGPGATVIMAAFTHLNPEGSRFTDGSFGVFYAALALETAIAETRHHRTRFLAATDEPAQEVDMRVYAIDLTADLHDIRGLTESHAQLYDPLNYVHGQGFGAELRDAGGDGIIYQSVRHAGGECAAAFRPRLLANCRQERHLCYVWNGTAIDTIYEKKNLES